MRNLVLEEREKPRAPMLNIAILDDDEGTERSPGAADRGEEVTPPQTAPQTLPEASV